MKALTNGQCLFIIYFHCKLYYKFYILKQNHND